MSRPELRPKGYFERVLGDGGRAPQTRTSSYRLLGLPSRVNGIAGVIKSNGMVLPPALSYLRWNPSLNDAVPELDGSAAHAWGGSERDPFRSRPALPQDRGESKSNGDTVRPGIASNSLHQQDASHVLTLSPAADDAKATSLWRPSTPAMPNTLRMSAKVEGSRAIRTEIAHPATSYGEAAERGSAEANGPFADEALNPSMLPPAIRPLVPMLGRIRLTGGSLGMNPGDSVLRTGNKPAGPVESDAMPSAESPAALRPSSREARVVRTGRWLANNLGINVQDKDAESTRVAPVHMHRHSSTSSPVSNLAAMPQLRNLRQIVHTYVTKALIAERAAFKMGRSEKDTEATRVPKPVRAAEHVISTLVFRQSRSLGAFSERRYLGRAHMRALR